jgi:hypothetical protein
MRRTARRVALFCLSNHMSRIPVLNTAPETAIENLKKQSHEPS